MLNKEITKLNSWVGVLVVAFIATAMGYLLATNLLMGIGVFALIVGVAVLIACLLSPETGFYVNMFYCFSVYQVGRMFFPEGLPVGVITDVLIVAMLFSFFIKGVSLKESVNRFTASPIVTLVIINFFYGSMELFNPEGHNFEAWLQAIRRAFETFIYLFVVFQLLRDKEIVMRFIRVLFVFCVLVAIYGCIQQWHGLFGFERAWAMADETRFGLLFIGGDFRKFSMFNDPTAFGTTMAACGVFYTILALNQRNKRVKRTYLAGVLIMLLAMAYSGTRTANVMLVAGFGFFALLTMNKKSTRTFTIVAALLFAAVLYAPIYSNSTINRFRSSFVGSEDESYKVRVLARNFIRPYMLSHPFGGGLATTGNLGKVMNPGHYLAGFQTDSGYVQLALETGWIGLAITCILFFLVLKGGAKAYFHTSDEALRPIFAAGTCAIFCYYVGMFAQNTLGNLTDMALYYPVIAIILQFKYYNNADKAHAAG